ncbi:hypothetical protein WJX81_004919 [Elliptochloris bilobata]|uniref:RWP-RK domain-containing protein n=1 Tax=Elliptochloris bilobata TaxID=381761 RepID=A0AAW1S5U3_9CHLO
MARLSADCNRYASQSSLPDLWPATPELEEQHGLLEPPVLAGWPNPSLQLEPAACSGPALASEAFSGAWLDAPPAHGAYDLPPALDCMFDPVFREGIDLSVPLMPAAKSEEDAAAATGRQHCALPTELTTSKELPLLDCSADPGRAGRRGFDRELTLQGLRDGGYFDMPIQEAAIALNMSKTVINRQLRRMGVARWPYRMRVSLCKLAAHTRHLLGDDCELLDIIQDEMQKLQGIKGEKVGSSLAAYRQSLFKYHHAARALFPGGPLSVSGSAGGLGSAAFCLGSSGPGEEVRADTEELRKGIEAGARMTAQYPA